MTPPAMVKSSAYPFAPHLSHGYTPVFFGSVITVHEDTNQEMGMLAEGVEFMAIGMGTVFAFLTLMVFAVRGAAWVIATYFPPPPEVAPREQAAATVSGDAEIAVVLAAAYRWRQGQGE